MVEAKNFIRQASSCGGAEYVLRSMSTPDLVRLFGAVQAEPGDTDRDLSRREKAAHLLETEMAARSCEGFGAKAGRVLGNIWKELDS
jgi:hypothetical protein